MNMNMNVNINELVDQISELTKKAYLSDALKLRVQELESKLMDIEVQQLKDRLEYETYLEQLSKEYDGGDKAA